MARRRREERFLPMEDVTPGRNHSGAEAGETIGMNDEKGFNPRLGGREEGRPVSPGGL